MKFIEVGRLEGGIEQVRQGKDDLRRPTRR